MVTHLTKHQPIMLFFISNLQRQIRTFQALSLADKARQPNRYEYWSTIDRSARKIIGHLTFRYDPNL